MIQPKGAIQELAFVVHDLERSILRWVHDLRAGPFYRGALDIPYSYQGEQRQIHLDFAGGFSGSLFIQLVQPDDQPSVFRDHLDQHGEGLHHIQLRSADPGVEARRLSEAGYQHLATGGIPGAGAAEYFDAYAHYGCQLKSLVIPDDHLAGFEVAQRAHRDWDGVTDPIRSFRDLGAPTNH